ncbi:MAG: hypothetical protein RW306_12525 [Geobacteraceae bacterium]|nr:hypothetical protein [Geobacteraceae bacterium]
MRKRTVRNGMRLVMAALMLIIVASFFHGALSDMFALSLAAESRIYRLGIFWAAAIGGYGVVLAAFGLVLPHEKRDEPVRILPLFILITGLIMLFFYLLAASFNAPTDFEQKRMRPGETITI